MSGLPLASRFLLCTIDDTTGRSRLAEGARAVGLAAALLGELLEIGAVRIRRAHVTATPHVQVPAGPAHQVHHQLLTDHSTAFVQVWLQAIGINAYEHVCQHLVASGHFLRQRHTRLLRPTVTRYVLRDLDDAASELFSLSARLSRGEVPRQADTLLCGLLQATGLGSALLQDLPSWAGDGLSERLAELPPSMTELIQHTQRVVGKGVLSHL
jgi:hypothetical protein